MTPKSLLVAIAICLVLHGGMTYAKDKTSPDDLRTKHGGLLKLTSDGTVSDLYPIIRDATNRCWSDVAYFPTVVGGAAGEVTRASRPVLAEMSPDGSHAYVIVQVRAAFGLHYRNFLQVDLDQGAEGTQVNVYYSNNVKGQRDFVSEVQHWLDGDTSWCAESPSKVKPKIAS